MALEWKMLVYFMVIWNIYNPLGHFMVIWCISWSLGIFYGHLVYFPVSVWSVSFTSCAFEFLGRMKLALFAMQYNRLHALFECCKNARIEIISATDGQAAATARRQPGHQHQGWLRSQPAHPHFQGVQERRRRPPVHRGRHHQG
jgi:hypothetical protein